LRSGGLHYSWTNFWGAAQMSLDRFISLHRFISFHLIASFQLVSKAACSMQCNETR
jgi:hypothetical protein